VQGRRGRKEVRDGGKGEGREEGWEGRQGFIKCFGERGSTQACASSGENRVQLMTTIK